MKNTSSRNHTPSDAHAPRAQELNQEELAGLLARLEGSAMAPSDVALLKSALTTVQVLSTELESKEVTLARLRRLLFGPRTEKTADLLKRKPSGTSPDPSSDPEGAPAPETSTSEASSSSPSDTPPVRNKAPGHGRNGIRDFTGAEHIKVPHDTLHHGQPCPGCPKGKLYLQATPHTLLRIRGMAPLGATCIALERLRCNGCGEVFTAPSPEGAGTEKYDETAAAMVGVLKYGTGIPFTRLEALQESLGIPLPASTQWELVSRAQPGLAPVHAELVRQAAEGEVFYNDDTTMRVLSMAATEALKTDRGEERTGVFTSGIVSQREGRTIALFYTGREHAGENLAKVLKERPAELSAPIQMSDALSRNVKNLGPTGSFKTVLASCLAHARREFVDVMDAWPEECGKVLTTLARVYQHDDRARVDKLTKDARLQYHQEHSRPLMDELHTWLNTQFDQHLVEPNSSLGGALRYLLNHWDKLTLFLRVPGAPLDNNICERALKKAILHRKNALFYKTLNGARVGDTFMTLIYTTELCVGNPFDYLVALLRHKDHVAASPQDWLPWTYQHTLLTHPATVASLGAGPL